MWYEFVKKSELICNLLFLVSHVKFSSHYFIVKMGDFFPMFQYLEINTLNYDDY
jgi:hypothetical protein